MNILQVNTEKGWRGGERQTLLTAEGLRETGIDVTILAAGGRPLHKKAREAGCNVIAVNSLSGALRYLLLNSKHYSLIHAQTARGYNAALFGTLFSRVPVICSRRVAFKPHGRWGSWKYRKAAALIAVSEAVRDILQHAGCKDVALIGDMHAGITVDSTRCRQFEKEYRLEGKAVVGVVAALTPEKDPLTMVHAASIVCGVLPDVRFVHFGSGVLDDRVAQECKKCGLEEKYLFPGQVNRVEELYGLFDVFALSSLQEGLGSSVLDAFFNRIPVAVTDAGGLGELVNDRGLKSAPGDGEALAHNIIRLLSERSCVQELTAAAYDYLMEHHSRDTVVGQTVSLYHKVLNSRRLTP